MPGTPCDIASLATSPSVREGEERWRLRERSECRNMHGIAN